MTNKLDFGRGGLAKTLTGFMAATDPFGFQPTLAVPRSILDRQSRLFQQVSAEGAELTVHHGTSPDGQPAAPAKYGESVRAAVDTFRKKDIPLSGLRTIGSDFTDQPAREMLAGLGVTYTYGRRLAWEVMDREQFPPGGLEEFERLKAAYGAGDPLVESSLPSGGDPIPDLPVVLPAFPSLKLSPEAAARLGEDTDPSPGLSSLVGKSYRRTPSGFPLDTVPLTAICVLGSGPSPRIVPLTSQAGMIELIRHSLLARFGEGMFRDCQESHFLQCADIARQVPVYRLVRPRSHPLLAVTARLIEGRFDGRGQRRAAV